MSTLKDKLEKDSVFCIMSKACITFNLSDFFFVLFKRKKNISPYTVNIKPSNCVVRDVDGSCHFVLK